MINYPDYIRKILYRLTAHGYKAYAVGGCVRDSVMGRVPHDWDVTSSALPEETQAVFDADGWRVSVGNGLKHGTVTVYSAELPHNGCEITTFRTEGTYSDHRRPDSVAFVRDVAQDLARRDFTMNAMAACPAFGDRKEEFIDLYGGVEDIRAGIVRCVRDPYERFGEDALRILRGIRFAARYGLTVEEKTAEAMVALAPTLREIAPERIGEELRGILLGADCGRQITRFGAVMQIILPRCGSEDAERLFPRVTDETERLALLLAPCGEKEIYTTLVRYGFGVSTATRMKKLRALLGTPLVTRADLCRIADALGKEDAQRYFAVRAALAGENLDGEKARTLALFEKGVCYNTATLAVGGADLIAIGIPAGREMGAVLKRLTELAVAGETENEKEELLEIARGMR